MMQDKIAEKEAEIAKAKEVYRRMKKEQALLRYCAQMSDAGLEAILDRFNPDEAGGDSESSFEHSADESEKKSKKKGKEN